MHIEQTWFPMISLGIILYYVISLYFGYKKGFFVLLIELFSLFLSLALAWFLSPIFSKMIQLFPKETISSNPLIQSLVSPVLNQVLWFIVIVIIINVFLFIFKPIARKIGEVPGIHFINGILGVVFSFVITTIYILILTAVLKMPFFDNGVETVENTVLKHVNKYSNIVFEYASQEIVKNEKIMNMISEDESVKIELFDLMKKYGLSKNNE
ncbi:hypothetical protein EII25_00320 [Erysipelotrichaceae bacterium OH741_COT-311]|nr:hypothetical protein EII25_00320 [Erysipelotrichaceae bacterium OH741_COT-311]